MQRTEPSPPVGHVRAGVQQGRHLEPKDGAVTAPPRAISMGNMIVYEHFLQVGYFQTSPGGIFWWLTQDKQRFSNGQTSEHLNPGWLMRTDL